jgi:hypothetical protein
MILRSKTIKPLIKTQPLQSSICSLSGTELFLACSLFDQNSTTQDLCKDVIRVICTIGISELEFPYQLPFQRGVLSWMVSNSQRMSTDSTNIIFCEGTLYEVGDKCKPVGRRSSSRLKDAKQSQLIEILGQYSSSTYQFRGNPVIFDLQKFKLRLTVMILSDTYNGLHWSLSKAKIYGSHNKKTWVLICRDSEVQCKSPRNAYQNVENRHFTSWTGEYYRYFKIESANHRKRMNLSGVEMWGYLIRSPI